MVMSGTGHISDELISQPLALQRFSAPTCGSTESFVRSISCALNVDILLSKSSAVWTPSARMPVTTSSWTCWRSQQLLVEMPRQQQRAVVEFAFGDFQRPLAVLHGEIAGAEHDRDHERRRTQDQPLDGTQPDPPRHAATEQRLALRDDVLR